MAIPYFLTLYLGGIVVSILPTYFLQKNNPDYNALGASGAVSALLFTFILFQPLQKICLYGILCLPGILLGVIYLGYSWYSARKQSDNVNHDAHFWGAIYGVLVNIAFNPSIVPYFINQLTENDLF